MDKLWAPWRYNYVQDLEKPVEGCIFCTKPSMDPSNDRENMILMRGTACFVIMNKYPYNNGHLMVVPYCHTCEIDTLDNATALELWSLVVKCRKVLLETLHPDGFNIGMNLGRVAGAGIDQHVHMHIVPRWNGDTNFMSVVCDTKVISQSICDGYDCLAPRFQDNHH